MFKSSGKCYSVPWEKRGRVTAKPWQIFKPRSPPEFYISVTTGLPRVLKKGTGVGSPVG